LKPRRVVISFDIETDLPVKVLREARVAWIDDIGRLRMSTTPVNRPRVEVIQPVKRKGKR